MLIRYIGVISWDLDPSRLGAMQTQNREAIPARKKTCRLQEEAADDYTLISEHSEQRHCWPG